MDVRAPPDEVEAGSIAVAATRGHDVEDDELKSLPADLECPVCFQLYCEPVFAGCNRHVFCRNCLLRSQRVGSMLRCPVCRAESATDAAEVPEVDDLVAKLKAVDAKYEERAAVARKEREDAWASHAFYVSGAGTLEANGTYVPSALPTYVGPMVYRKPNSYFFIYRWQKTHWVIAELRGPYSMGNQREWLYRAPAQQPAEFPPAQGWEVPARSYGTTPAPEVRFGRAATQSSPTGDGAGRRRGGAGGAAPAGGTPGDTGGGDAAATAPAGSAWLGSPASDNDAQVGCRCGLCCLM